MKKLCVLIVLALSCSAAIGQADSLKSFKFSLVNKKGRLVENADITLWLAGDSVIHRLQADGTALLYGVAPDATLVVTHDGSHAFFALDGLYELTAMLHKKEVTLYKPAAKRAAPARTYDDDNARSATKVNLNNITLYNTLSEYLVDRVPRVTVHGGHAYVGGGGPALIVLDGVIMPSLTRADIMVRVSQIKSVEVDKIGSSYGMRGMNGVIIITTKKREDEQPPEGEK